MSTKNETHFCTFIAPSELSEDAKRILAGRKAALLNDYRWPTASTISIRFLEGDARLRSRVTEVARHWTGSKLANLTLNFVPTGQADVRIAFVGGAGSWSYLGTYCRTIPQDKATMNFGWLTAGSSDEDVRSVVLHEFGHALGLIHEHQSPDHPINWNKDAVRRDLSGPPNNWDEDTIKRNVFDRYDPKAVSSTPVDRESIMMYAIPKSWTNDGFSAGFNTDLSAQDRTFIHQSYP